jgi:hypothetical protein
LGPSGFGSSGFGIGFGSSGFGSCGFGFGSGSWAWELWFWILVIQALDIWPWALALDLWIWIFGVGFLTWGLWFGVQAGAMGLEGLGGGLGGTPTCIMMQIVKNLCFIYYEHVVPMWERISGAIGWRWGEGVGFTKDGSRSHAGRFFFFSTKNNRKPKLCFRIPQVTMFRR